MYYVLCIVGFLFIIHATNYLLPTVHAANCDPNLVGPRVPGDCPAGLQQIEDLFKQIITVATGLGFIALLVLIVFAGFKYLMSGGEQKAVQAAHQTVTWALLGIVFMAIAWLILQLIHAFTGVDVTTFTFGLPK